MLTFTPIYLYSKTKTIIHPTAKSRNITIATGEDIEVHCTSPMGFHIGKTKTVYPLQKLVLRCVFQWKFQAFGKLVDLRHISCVERVNTVAL